VNSVQVLPCKPSFNGKDASRILAPFEKNSPVKEELDSFKKDLADLEKTHNRTQDLLGASRKERIEQAPGLYKKHLDKLEENTAIRILPCLIGAIIGTPLALVSVPLFCGLAFGGCLTGFIIDSIRTSNRNVDRSMLEELKATLLNLETRIPGAREKIEQLQEKIISGVQEDPDAVKGGTIEDELDFVLIDDLKIKKNKQDRAMSLFGFWKKRSSS